MKKILTLLCLILITCSLFATALSNPVSIALGDAFITKARGFHALHWNPANLGILDNDMTFNLIQISSDVRNNAFLWKKFPVHLLISHRSMVVSVLVTYMALLMAKYWILLRNSPQMIV